MGDVVLVNKVHASKFHRTRTCREETNHAQKERENDKDGARGAKEKKERRRSKGSKDRLEIAQDAVDGVRLRLGLRTRKCGLTTLAAASAGRNRTRRRRRHCASELSLYAGVLRLPPTTFTANLVPRPRQQQANSRRRRALAAQNLSDTQQAGGQDDPAQGTATPLGHRSKRQPTTMLRPESNDRLSSSCERTLVEE